LTVLLITGCVPEKQLRVVPRLILH